MVAFSTIFLGLVLLCLNVNGGVIQRRDIIDHDVVVFRFPTNTPEITCESLLEDTIITALAGSTVTLDGNCYMQSNRAYLEIFLEHNYDQSLLIDFTATTAASHVPVAYLNANANEGSINIFQRLDPAFDVETHSTGLEWKTCTEESSNKFWVWHNEIMDFSYAGCVDNNCVGGDPYTSFAKCNNQFDDPHDFPLLVRMSSVGPDGWAFCSNENAEAVVVGGDTTQRAVAIGATSWGSVTEGPEFTVDSSGRAHWQSTCNVASDGVLVGSAYVTPSGDGCFVNFFKRDGSGTTTEFTLSTDSACNLPQLSISDWNNLSVALFWMNEPSGGLKIRKMTVDLDTSLVGAPGPFSPQQSGGSRRGAITRSAKAKTRAICWMDGNTDSSSTGQVLCRLFDDWMAAITDQFVVVSSGNDGENLYLAANPEKAQFIVAWRSGSDLNAAMFDGTETVQWSHVIGSFSSQPYIDSSVGVSLRADGTSMIGWEGPSEYNYRVVNEDGSFRGNTLTVPGSGANKQGPALFLGPEGQAMTAVFDGSDVWAGRIDIPCPH